MDFVKLSAEQRNSLENSTAKYAAALPGSPALTYLEGRGIPAHVALTVRAGFVADPETEHEQFRGRLALPFITPSGVVAIRFRSLDASEPKYLQPSGSATHLYNMLSMHRASDYVAICEGEIDALVLSELCGVPAVGLTGVSAWKKYYRRLFFDYQRAFIVMDGDKAGREAAKKLRDELSNGVIVDLGEGDVNENFQKHGADFVRGKLGLE